MALEVALGGNEERVGFNCELTNEAKEEIIRGVRRMMPSIEIVSMVDHIAGLRPMVVDDVPILGALPGWENVCLACGGGRKGMLYGSAMGRCRLYRFW